jgi:hypothetical protein
MFRAADTDESEATDVGSVASDIEAALTDPRRKPHEGPLRVLAGKERSPRTTPGPRCRSTGFPALPPAP